MVMGKTKGGAFERLIYKELRNYGTCKRTIGSGSSDEPADILFKNYAIELKHLKQVRWSMLTKFWSKLKKQVDEYNVGFKDNTLYFEPVIIFRQNREPIMVMCLMDYNKKNVRAITSYNLWKLMVVK